MAGNLNRTLAVDAMGADRGPSEVVYAVKQFLEETDGSSRVVLVGQQEVLTPLLKESSLDKNERLELLHAAEVIGMDEKPIKSIKQKKDSSLVRTVELVKEGRCQAAVSCGNTGSLMACGTIKLRPMPGVERPALGSIWPSREQHFVILDVGANPMTKPEHHVHNAILGTYYCRLALGRDRPRVGLLSVGTEESKGHDAIQAANQMLRAIGDMINYVGPIEGFDVFNNRADVILCDGFTGNVLLKTCESLFASLKGIIKDEMTRTPIRKIGALLSKPAFADVKRRLDPDRYGGAPLLGLQGNILKSHGSSNRYAIASAMRIALEFAQHNLTESAQEDIAKANQILKGMKSAGGRAPGAEGEAEGESGNRQVGESA